MPTMPKIRAVLDACLAPSTFPSFHRLLTCAEKYMPIAPTMKKQRNEMMVNGQYAEGFTAPWLGPCGVCACWGTGTPC
jgi:hypothetical protein